MKKLKNVQMTLTSIKQIQFARHYQMQCTEDLHPRPSQILQKEKVACADTLALHLDILLDRTQLSHLLHHNPLRLSFKTPSFPK